jgi:V/A-type H+-transporting ATPase subunit E
MALEDIIGKIKRDAEEEASRIAVHAEEEAQEILRRAEAEAQEEEERELRRAEVEAQEEKRRILALSRLETRRELLSAKQRSVDEVFDLALERLRRLDDDRYLELVKKLICKAVETGREKVLVSPSDRGRVTPSFLEEVSRELREKGDLSPSLTLQVAEEELGGGVKVLGEGTEMDCTFAQVLEDMREELEPLVVSILFPADEAGSAGAGEVGN